MTTEAPEGWRILRLGEVASVVGGGTPSRENAAYWNGGIPWATPTDITNLRGHYIETTASTISEQGLATSSACLLPTGTVLMTSRATIGACAIARRPMATNQGFQSLIPSATTSPEFLLYVVSESRDRLTRLAGGSTFLEVSKKSVVSLPIMVPPLPEQRKIAAILSSVDDAIETTQAVVDQLQVVERAMMAELLTRGVPGRPTRIVMTEIGEVPEGWRVVKLGDVCERMFVGIAQSATHAYVASEGVPIIRTTNVRPNRLQSEGVLQISSAFAKEMRSKALRAGDVLSARTGNPGTSVVVPPEYDGAQCFTLLVSRPGPDLDARYLCHLMNSALGERIVTRGQVGGAQQNLNVGVFKEALIPLPPRPEQEQIAFALDAVHARKEKEENVLRQLDRLRSSLMSVLLAGEVRVAVDERENAA